MGEQGTATQLDACRVTRSTSLGMPKSESTHLGTHGGGFTLPHGRGVGWCQQQTRTRLGRGSETRIPGPTCISAPPPSPRVPKEPHKHRLSVATSCLSPGAASSRDHIQGPLSPEPWPRILENEHDSGKCTQARLTLKLVASLPCPNTSCHDVPWALPYRKSLPRKWPVLGPSG